MGWVLLSLRQNDLQTKINDTNYELLQISSQLDSLSTYSTIIADGQITASEITSLDSSLFGDALDFMGYCGEIAAERADEQTSYYATAYDDATSDQLTDAGLALYTTEDGTLDEDALYEEFYEQALEEFAEDYYMPIINEKEKELTTEKTNLETLLTSYESELESVKSAKSSQIQSNTIQLS